MAFDQEKKILNRYFLVENIKVLFFIFASGFQIYWFAYNLKRQGISSQIRNSSNIMEIYENFVHAKFLCY